MENPFRRKKRWSSLTTNLFVAAITFAIGIGAHWALTFRNPKPTPQQPPQASAIADPRTLNADPGTLRASIRDAKAKGENTVEFGSIGCGWDIGSLRAALSRDTVVLAELVEKKTYEDTWGLRTWYKFKIKETLVEHALPRRDGFQS